MYNVHVCLPILIFCCAGVVGATFATGACFAARLRDKDDYKNAVIGGMLAGSIFGYRSKRAFIYYMNAVHCWGSGREGVITCFTECLRKQIARANV